MKEPVQIFGNGDKRFCDYERVDGKIILATKYSSIELNDLISQIASPKAVEKNRKKAPKPKRKI